MCHFNETAVVKDNQFPCYSQTCLFNVSVVLLLLSDHSGGDGADYLEVFMILPRSLIFVIASYNI